MPCTSILSLRLYSIVASIPSRMNEEEEELGGYKILKHTMISCNTYSLHYSAELWDSPFEFNPDRYLKDKNIKLASWLPFGMGNHLCIGKGFSISEQAVFLALLFRDYEVSVKEEMTIGREFLFAPKPYTLYLKKRN